MGLGGFPGASGVKHPPGKAGEDGFDSWSRKTQQAMGQVSAGQHDH